MTKKVICQYCKKEVVATLHVQLFSNASRNYVWRCGDCSRPAPEIKSPLYIAKDKVEQHLTAEKIAALPVIMPTFYDRCAVCGDRAVEDHHWAPKAIFGEEAERWPHDKLCKVHHDIWHMKVTPNISQA